MFRTTRIACAGLIALFVGVGAAQAQLSPQEPQPPPTRVPAPAETGILTIDDVKSMLEKEGFKPELTPNDKAPYIQVVIKQDGLMYPVRVMLSTSGRKVWLFISTRTFGPDEEIPRDRLVDLMDSDKRIGAGHFEYSRTFRQLQYVTNFDARGIKPEDLSRELQEFVTSLKEHPAVWNFSLTAKQ